MAKPHFHAPLLVYASVASIALHATAFYAMSRLPWRDSSATRASIQLRRGDHAIQVRVRLAPSEPINPPDHPDADTPIAPAPPEPAPAPQEITAPTPTITRAAPATIDESAWDESSRRLAEIVVTQASDLVQRLERSLREIHVPSPRTTSAPPVEEHLTTEPPPAPSQPISKSPAPTRQVTKDIHSSQTHPSPPPAADRDAGVTRGAFAVDLPAPRYPLQSRRLGEEGLVLLEVEVLANGRTGAVRVIRAPRYARLRAAAIDAVRRARFAPARRHGEPITSAILVPIRFRLR